MQGRPPTPESQASLFRSPSPSLTASSTSLPLSPHWLVRFVTLLARSIPVSIPLSIHVSSTDPSSARSPRLCNIQPTILYRLYRKLSSHLSRAWLPTRASCIPIYSGAWIEKRDRVRKQGRIDLIRLTMIRYRLRGKPNVRAYDYFSRYVKRKIFFSDLVDDYFRIHPLGVRYVQESEKKISQS